MNSEREIMFGMEGYEFICMNQTNKHGGGVAMYVDSNCSYKVIENKFIVVALFECLTIEITRIKRKNIILSCIHRTPGLNINAFSN